MTADEIREQPDVLDRLLRSGLPHVRRTAARLADRRPRHVMLTARGSGDNAALHGTYVLAGLPAGLTALSTTTLYGARPALRGALVVTIPAKPRFQGSLGHLRAFRSAKAENSS